MLRTLALLVVCLIAAPAAAQAAATALSSQSTAKQSATPEKKVCRSEPVTGSMMVHRTCRTQDDWDKEAAVQADVNHFRDQQSLYATNPIAKPH